MLTLVYAIRESSAILNFLGPSASPADINVEALLSPALEQFAQDLETEGKSHETMRLYLFQVRTTARFRCRNYPEHQYQDIGAFVKTPARPRKIERLKLVPDTG